MIPRVIHFIFFGFTPFQTIHYLAVKSAIKVHQVPVRLYYSQAPQLNPLWDEIAGMVELVRVDPPTYFRGQVLESYQYKADVLRLETLLAQGGVYLDIDVISLRPFGDLWNENCVLGIEDRDGTSITNAVIMSVPGHGFISTWLDQTGMALGQNRPWAWHGVCLPHEIYHGGQWPDVRLEPRSSFMPFDFREPYIFSDDAQAISAIQNSYTMHMWDTIWNPQLAQITLDSLRSSHSNLARIVTPYLGTNTMPTSSERGKKWIKDQISRITASKQPQWVLDIGAGSGTYWEKFHDLMPQAQWVAIEIWENYVREYLLEKKYQRVLVQDAREVDYTKLGVSYDIVFAGDVLEHMTLDQARNLVDRVLGSHRCMIVSIPVVYMPQGEFANNPHERHIKDDWSDSEFREVFGDVIVAGEVDAEIGTYVLSRDRGLMAPSPDRLRIAIYTICKNEAQNVQAWADSNSEADLRLVCDTGSSDDTVDQLRAHGVTVHNISVLPWRFDLARQTSLNLLPPDIDVCIWQDLDERLLPGWRQQIEQSWTPETTTANHRYRNNGRAWQWHSKIHARHNCRWTGAVHETLSWSVPEHAIWIPEFYLDEYQDFGKSRTSYIHLLEQKIREGDRNWRTYHFYSNELLAQNRLGDCIEQRKKAYEACDEGDVSQGYVARTLAEAFANIGQHTEAQHWFQKSVDHSNERESWHAWALYCYGRQDWENCYLRAKKALAITVPRDGFTYNPAAWDYSLFDIAAQAAYRIGLKPHAVDLGLKALEMKPDDERLRINQDFYDEACAVALPEVLTVETSGNCNRTCGTCIRNSDPDRSRVASWFQDNFMDMDTLRRIFEDARSMGYRQDLCLSFYNEPTQDPRLPEIVDLARNYPFRNIFIHSNGDFMTPELAQRLDGKLSWIFFSIYADEPARTRRQEELQQMFQKTETRFGPGLHGLTHYGPEQDVAVAIPQCRDLSCGEPLDRFIINHRGEMTLCCDDMVGHYDLGNVRDSCLWDLWFGEKHQNLVKRLRRPRGRHGLTLCESCPRPYQKNFKVKNIKS